MMGLLRMAKAFSILPGFNFGTICDDKAFGTVLHSLAMMKPFNSWLVHLVNIGIVQLCGTSSRTGIVIVKSCAGGTVCVCYD